jgi:hypothetical protein
MSNQSLNLERVAQPPTRLAALRITGRKPPELQLDPRYTKAFPEQAAMLREFSNDLQVWWRDISLELARES